MRLQVVRRRGAPVLREPEPAPVVDPEDLEHLAVEVEQPTDHPVGHGGAHLLVVAVEQQRRAIEVVGRDRAGEHLGHLLLGRGGHRQVDARVERATGGTEGEQHDRVGGVEAEDHGHEGDQVDRRPCDEGGLRRGGGGCHAQHARPRDRPDASRVTGAGGQPGPEGALWTRNGRVRVRRSAGARRPDDPARRPRRLLRLGRAARQALAAGQAGRRRRHRRQGRRGHGVVRGARVRGPLGHAHGGGAPALSQRGLPHRPLPRLPRGEHRGDGAAPLDQPAGRAAVPGRGVRRPRGGRPARPLGHDGQRPRPRAEGACPRRHRRPHRVGRHRHVQAGGQDRQRPRQARRHGRRRARDGAGAAAPDAGDGDPRCRAGDHRAAAPGRRPHGRGARGPHPRRAGADARVAATAPASTTSPGPRTTGTSCPCARPSRSASRTPTRSTTSTSDCSRRCWTARRPRSPNDSARPAPRAAPSRSRSGCTTSRR